MKSVLCLILFILCAMMVLPVQATQRHTTIEQGVERYLLDALAGSQADTNVQVEVVGIDSRIAIPECAEGFTYHADDDALAQSYISVRVSCRNNDWYLFSSAQVSRTRQIVVTAGMISPGTVLSAENLQLADIDVKRLRHTAYSGMEQLIGARMKRRVREGSPVQANMLCFVCKGDRITITARTAGMQVKTSGIAQQDGVVGDTIEVVNASSKKSVIAEVASAQTVVVNL
ncbi:flagellar basal body P-ring formation chaperone FlgA [Alteromonas halophila]|nr:flagellar basal body P-ring formation chaperone FlgA [Alteromonas halophila]